ncbi:unnamed protein product, partial [Didymodactylos carnosus]
VMSKPLNPKKLIETYKLEKSHLAFTLCTKQADNIYITHSETTVISRLMTEGVLKSSTKQTYQFTCPHCTHCFALSSSTSAQSETTNSSTKRKTDDRTPSIKKYDQTDQFNDIVGETGVQNTDDLIATNSEFNLNNVVIQQSQEIVQDYQIFKNFKLETVGSILLSGSVAIIPISSDQLQLVHPLEETYRSRYKSDYFPENGQVRKPRYVTDSVRNHFVSIKIPSIYFENHCKKYIRVDWITTSKDGQPYYMPYKFQTNNDKRVLDIILGIDKIQTRRIEKCSGIDAV